MWSRECPNPTDNPRCKCDISYKHELNYLNAIKKNTVCASCLGLKGIAEGNATKRKTGNWGIETKRKNGTLKHTDNAKQNISDGLHSSYENGIRVS